MRHNFSAGPGALPSTVLAQASQALLEVGPHLLCIRPVLIAHHEVVRVAHDHYATARMPLAPLN